MPEPSTFPEEHVTEPLVYRRVSGFAIAGLAVAVCFALYIVVAGAWAWYQGSPLLLPVVMQMLPLIGTALSVTAMLLISRSEGTLAGVMLALAGFLVSVVFGLGYAAYYGAIYFAVRQQANDWTLKWFDKLKQGTLERAFLDTLEPGRRASINADNPADMERFNLTITGPEGREMRGMLDQFREHQLIQLILQGGPETEVQPLGLKDWEYKNDAYKIKRAYRIITPEGTFEIVVPVVGSVSRKREYPGRQWHVEFRELNLQLREPSPLGQKVMLVRKQSQLFLQKWGDKLSRGDLESAYLDTLEESQRPQAHAEYARYASRLLLAGLGAEAPSPAATAQAIAVLPIVNPELGRELYLPGYYEKFRKAGILGSEKLKADDEELKTVVLVAARAIFGSPGNEARFERMLQVSPTSAQHPWKLSNNRLALAHDCRLGFKAGGIPKYMCEATITVESDPGPVDAQRQPAWRVVSVELTRAQDASRMTRPGGRMMAPGGDMPPPPPPPP